MIIRKNFWFEVVEKTPEAVIVTDILPKIEDFKSFSVLEILKNTFQGLKFNLKIRIIMLSQFKGLNFEIFFNEVTDC